MVENCRNIGMVMLSFIEIMTREDREILWRCGLLKVTRMPQYMSNQRLLIDIMSHWDRSRYVFHLPQVGDVSVTPGILGGYWEYRRWGGRWH